MSTPTAHDSAVLNAIFNPLLPLGQQDPEPPAPAPAPQEGENHSLQLQSIG